MTMMSVASQGPKISKKFRIFMGLTMPEMVTPCAKQQAGEECGEFSHLRLRVRGA